ncbi:predicted protein [Chaetoceros tenuissimus]|uniref:Uncharacterized protein n=1 Tax=Chaetoceros tenuissimus TaxID=426638 RepID=A0AAD3CF61_9STRA|nr:predicted protein [Chaetoceros tenuissimus]
MDRFSHSKMNKKAAIVRQLSGDKNTEANEFKSERIEQESNPNAATALVKSTKSKMPVYLSFRQHIKSKDDDDILTTSSSIEQNYSIGHQEYNPRRISIGTEFRELTQGYENHEGAYIDMNTHPENHLTLQKQRKILGIMQIL